MVDLFEFNKPPIGDIKYMQSNIDADGFTIAFVAKSGCSNGQEIVVALGFHEAAAVMRKLNRLLEPEMRRRMENAGVNVCES